MENMTAGRLAEIAGGTILQGDPETAVSHISIDSRTIGEETLFVPLIGERVDAHRFLMDVADGKAACVLCSEPLTPTGSAVWIQVEDTYNALVKIGTEWRGQMDALKVVAVTGSVGKTTTREMIATVLSSAYRTFRTAKNYNSDIGVPIMLSELSGQDEMAVLELGMSNFGEMEKITRMARPDMAVITNIGVAHIAQLGTRENICKEKLSVTRGMRPGSILILNGDDDLLKKTDRNIGFRLVFYGMEPDNDYHAENIVFSENGTEFTAVTPDGEISVHLPVTGNHMVMNALAALATADANGISLKQAAKALEEFQPFKGRQQIYPVKNFRVIDDAYNASPDSMRAALGVLTSISCEGRRIAVLSNMLELGEDECLYHRQVGVFAGELPLDQMVCVGDLAAQIGLTAKEKNAELPVHYFAANREAADYLRDIVSDGDLLLFKGSNSTHIGEIIALLKEEQI